MNRKNAADTEMPNRRDYIVMTPVEWRGDIYRTGATLALTDEEAEHPLKVGAVKLKGAAE